MKKKVILLSAGFLAGIIFSLPRADEKIVSFISFLFQKSLDPYFWSQGLQLFGAELALLCFLFFISTFIKNKRLSEIIFPVGVYGLFFSYLFLQACNAPINDDITTVFSFSNAWHDASSFSEKMNVLFSFHGECRLVFTRLFVLFFQFVSGAINIKTMLLFSNLCLILIFLLFKKNALKIPEKKFLLIFSGLLLFQFSFYDSIVWFTDALHYQYVVLFFLLFLTFLTGKKKYSTPLSVLFAVMACLTFGNGFLCFPIAILYCVVNKNFRHLFYWSIALICTAGFYFHNFPLQDSTFAWTNCWKIPVYSCCFVGGSFQFFQNLWLPFLAGLSVWILLFILIKKKYYQSNFFIFAVLLFVCFSSLIAGIFRINSGISEAISNRYGFFSILAFIASVIALTEISLPEKKNKILKIAATAAVLFYLMSAVFFYPEIPVRKKKLEKFIS
ncbi:MAG: hypothetical protein IAF38_13330, partial [Bacteroidia bacterium]|nr:hypothetical protein [Bacteroidia bacterium]